MRSHQANQHSYLQHSWTKILCEASNFFKLHTHQVDSAKHQQLARSEGCKTSPLQQGSLHGRNTGILSPSTPLSQGIWQQNTTCPAQSPAPCRGNTLPFQVTGDAKTREAQARLAGKHTKPTQSQTLKQHLSQIPQGVPEQISSHYLIQVRLTPARSSAEPHSNAPQFCYHRLTYHQLPACNHTLSQEKGHFVDYPHGTSWPCDPAQEAGACSCYLLWHVKKHE